ncbi:hypothetical protein SAMN05660493_00774 [Epilithonimonas bovis DSM 19482]|uniref:Uncharacterized protein n=2 Tax=Epilithonimonas TaxID=2782229 RepID=A0A1U7PVX1_9FLAO|nr:hypothetical protein SAMN05660493_00774 [Epilithonimonas bovis DSM 19482]
MLLAKSQPPKAPIMIKYSLLLLVPYFLYYAGNIVYDLFIKKEKISEVDMTEEFSLADISKSENQPSVQVGIEDVENIKTPKSYLKKDINPAQNPNSFEENPSLDELRKRFEAEQDIDEIFPTQKNSENKEEKEPEKPSDKENFPNQNINKTDENSKRKAIVKKENQWKDFLNLAETTVKMVANLEGHKVYHSLV